MNRIQQTIERVLERGLTLEQQPDYCLRAARQVIEAANGWTGGEFYTRLNLYGHMTLENRRRAPGVPWARSAEQACLDQGWTVDPAQARPGDLAFSRRPADFGHIGVIGRGADGGLWVLENAQVRRGQHLGGAINWVPLKKFAGLTTVGRLPWEWVFDEDPDAPTPPPTSPAVTIIRPAPPTVTVPSIPATPPPKAPKTKPSSARRVVVNDGTGTFYDRTGQRYTLPLGDGRVLIVNSLDPNDVYVDIRREN